MHRTTKAEVQNRLIPDLLHGIQEQTKDMDLQYFQNLSNSNS